MIPASSINGSANRPAPTRRDVLATGLAATALGALAVPRAVHADGAGSERLRLGLVGCGGRGLGAAIDALNADAQIELVAVADAFADRAELGVKQLQRQEKIGERVRVEPDAMFAGFDAYRKLIDSSVDVVILATPPHFRPEHLEYAVEKGKHCFVEKPIAVDVPGVRRAQAACRAAQERSLSIFSGLVWRVDEGVGETIDRIRDGAVGDVVAVQSAYNAGPLWHRGDKPQWSRMEYQVRNWLYFTWLSGDQPVEQAIHSLDKVSWVLGEATPLSAVGMGGRQQRVAPMWGNVFDHHAVTFDFPNGVKCFFTCRQQEGVANFTDEIVLGTKGRALLLGRTIEGENPWKQTEPTPIPYQRELELLLSAVRRGTPINHGESLCRSTLLAVMARMASYSGKEITWEQLMQSQDRLGPTDYAWGPAPDDPVAIPGTA